MLLVIKRCCAIWSHFLSTEMNGMFSYREDFPQGSIFVFFWLLAMFVMGYPVLVNCSQII